MIYVRMFCLCSLLGVLWYHVFKPFWVYFFVWCEGMFPLHWFPCKCPTLQTSLGEETVFSPLYTLASSVEDYLTVGVWSPLFTEPLQEKIWAWLPLSTLSARWWYNEKTAICESGRAFLPDRGSVGVLISNLQPPEMGEINVYCLSTFPPNLW